MPDDLVGSLTGLTEGRFPVAARARYADDLSEREARSAVRDAARTPPSSSRTRRPAAASTSSPARARPVVAVNDGVIKKIGRSRASSAATSCSRTSTATASRTRTSARSRRRYPVPKERRRHRTARASAISRANDDASRRARVGRPPARHADSRRARRVGAEQAAPAPRPRIPSRSACSPTRSVPTRATPAATTRSSTRRASSTASPPSATTSRARSASTPRTSGSSRCKEGSRVIGGTILGRIGQTVEGKAAARLLRDPAGRPRRAADRPEADPRRLEAARGDRDLPRGGQERPLRRATALSIGQILLMPKPLLEKRVLADERIEIYPCGRHDIRAGQIDRRVLATLEVLAERGFRTDGHLAQVRPRLLHVVGQRLAALVRQRGRHREDQRHPDPRPPGARRHHRPGGQRCCSRCRARCRPTRSSRCSTKGGPTRSRWATTTTTSTSASGRCSARTRSRACRRSPC